MIVSSTVGRCWMAYLLLVTHVVLTSSSPVPKQSANDKKKLCGPDFSNRLKDVCVIYKGTWLNPSSISTMPSEGNDFKSQDEVAKAENRRYPTKNECCSIGCNDKDLQSYCAVIRNQTTVQSQNNQELSAPVMTDPEFLELLPTTEPPSDSTPEYILNESLEQEALTILSTYRTPQYSINSLQFL